MRVNRAGKAQLFVLFLVLAYPAWLRGGTTVLLQAPLPWLGVLLGLSILVAPMAYREQGAPLSVLRATTARLLRDPVLYLGLAFLLLLSVQWWNAGRSLVFDQPKWKWVYSAPKVPWLPSAIDKGDAFQMLCWFFPAWTVMLAMRSGRLEKAELRALCFLMSINAALIALFGIIQYASGTQSIYWCQPMDDHFFASFGYPSHAGAFFLLMFAASCGLILHGLFCESYRSSWAERAVTIPASLLCLAGATLSLALAPIMLVWLVAVAAVVYAVIMAWQRLSPVRRVYLLVGIGGVACLAYVLMAILYHISPERVEAGLWEFRESHLLAKKYGERAFLAKAATAIWKDYPWFGTGGWGYRYLLGMYVDVSRWSTFKPGDANVHNDILQFLTEFGTVGAGLMVAMVAVLLVSVYRARAWRNPLAFLPLLGAVVVLLYSLMDLPFRCPAILYAWLAVLAAMPGFMGEEPATRME